MKYSEWIVPKVNPESVSRLCDAGYAPLLAALLESRGFSAPAQAGAFLNAGPELLGDPMAMRDMARAAERLQRAIAARETVAIFGDYDVDGISSVCLMALYLRGKGLSCTWYIPDRIGEGYGLNTAAIDAIGERGATLIITVDCGITAFAEATHAKSLGIDMIITDHHECACADLPDAYAVVDPKRPDCTGGNPDLAGVGVAFKLLCAVEGDSERVLGEYADLVAAGTVADVMPLVGENRYIVKRGLARLAERPRPGIRALLQKSGAAGRKMDSSMLSFTLAPRLNAAGRLGQADIAVRLLLTDSEAEADRLAEALCQFNTERKSLEQSIWHSAHTILERDPPTGPIVLTGESWHQGVIGIAASRLSDEYSLPVIMISLDGELGKGSCRSAAGFNLFEALSACSEHLVSFGGHEFAAGLTIERGRIDDFRRALGEYYSRRSRPDAARTLACDFLVTRPELLSVEGVRSLDRLEPFGQGNLRPALCMYDLRLDRVTPIGGGAHLRLALSKPGYSFSCVAFSWTEDSLGIPEGSRVDVAFCPQINDFRGRQSVQLMLADIRLYDAFAACGELLGEPEPDLRHAAGHLPARADFVAVWRWLEGRGGRLSFKKDNMPGALPPGLHPVRFALCIRIMADEKLLGVERHGDEYIIEAFPIGRKADLEGSALFVKLRAAAQNI